jgi:hypothetical protein
MDSAYSRFIAREAESKTFLFLFSFRTCHFCRFFSYFIEIIFNYKEMKLEMVSMKWPFVYFKVQERRMNLVLVGVKVPCKA